MTRLPTPGADEGDWGDILNDYLSVAHTSDGSLKSSAVSDDTSTQRLAFSKDGVAVAERPHANFISGANTTLTVTDNVVNNRVDVTIAATASAASDAGAAALGLVGQTIQISQATTRFSVNSGVCVFMLIRLPAASVSALGAWRPTEGSGATGTCGMALYSEAGVLIDQTVSMAAAFATPGNLWISGNLSGGSQAISAGTYYISFLSNMTTGPQVAATPITTDAPAINGHYPSVYLTGRSSFPASFTPATATKNNGVFHLAIY